MTSTQSVELVLRGYRAFVAGDFATVAGLLAPDVEWYGTDGEGPAGTDEIQEILAARFADGYRIELERCVGKGNEVLLAFRAAGVEKDLNDDRPLQTRRYFTIGRYWAIATVAGGRIARVQDYPSLTAALDALGVSEEEL
jgi:ketosteroid isomerase-like protein